MKIQKSHILDISLFDNYLFVNTEYLGKFPKIFKN